MAGEGVNLGTATGYIEIRDNIDAATQAAKRAFDDAISGVSGKMQQFGQKMEDVGKKMTGVGTSILTLTGPLLAIGGAALAFSVKFEDAFANVEKTVDGTDEELAALKKTLREMATSDTPIGSLDNALLTLTGIAQLGGSLGVPLKDLKGFVETVALLDAASDDLDAEQAGTFIGQFANVTKLPVDQWDNLADAIVRLGNGMATTEGQITEFGRRLAPLAGYGWNADKIVAYSAALASLGVSPELGGTNLMKSVQDMTEAVALGGPKLEAFAEAAGLTADEFKALAEADPEGAFNKFIEGLSKMDADDQLATLRELGITGTEQISTIQRLASGYSTLTQALGLAGDAWTKGGDALAEATKKADTTQGKINEVTNKAREMGLVIGDTLKPKLDQMLESLGPIIESITDWAAKNPELVSTIAALTIGAAAVGVVLVGVGLAVSAAGVAFSGLAAAVGLVSAPFLLLVGAIGLLVFTWNTLKDGLIASWKDAFEQIGIFIGHVIDKVQGLIDKIKEMTGLTPSVGPVPVDAGQEVFKPSDWNPAGPTFGALDGFAKGGYTGDGPANEIAGVVHRNEWVFNRDQLGGLMNMLGNAGMGGGRKVADTVNIYADTREGGYAAAQGFDEELRFALRS
jgi:TP901 family phage tail tape measure protein